VQPEPSGFEFLIGVNLMENLDPLGPSVNRVAKGLLSPNASCGETAKNVDQHHSSLACASREM
jgi:hypothetical protein